MKLRHGTGFAVEEAKRRQLLFLGVATPESVISLIKDLLINTSLSRSDILKKGYRNAALDLTSLNLCYKDKDILHTRLSPKCNIEQELIKTLNKNKPLNIVKNILENEPSISRIYLGEKFGSLLGRTWKETSALRNANGLYRYWQYINNK